MSTSKTGKHGHAKVKFTGVDIFTAKKYQELQASTHNMLEVIVTKTDYFCLNVREDGQLHLLDKDNQPGPVISVDAEDFNYKGNKQLSLCVNQLSLSIVCRCLPLSCRLPTPVDLPVSTQALVFLLLGLLMC